MDRLGLARDGWERHRIWRQLIITRRQRRRIISRLVTIYICSNSFLRLDMYVFTPPRPQPFHLVLIKFEFNPSQTERFALSSSCTQERRIVYLRLNISQVLANGKPGQADDGTALAPACPSSSFKHTHKQLTEPQAVLTTCSGILFLFVFIPHPILP